MFDFELFTIQGLIAIFSGYHVKYVFYNMSYIHITSKLWLEKSWNLTEA